MSVIIDLLSRDEARAAGSKRYFTGVLCKNGHISERYSLSTACCKCVSERATCYAKMNPTVRAAAARRYNQKNPEKGRAQSYKWRASHPDRWKAICLKSYQNNREANVARAQDYRNANGEQIRRRFRAAYAANPEPKLRTVKRWSANNPGSIAARDLRRRASRAQAMPTWLTKEQRKEINQFYKEARRLTRITGIDYHVDHVYPLKSEISCGLHVPWNLQIITAVENMRKGNKSPDFSL